MVWFHLDSVKQKVEISFSPLFQISHQDGTCAYALRHFRLTHSQQIIQIFPLLCFTGKLRLCTLTGLCTLLMAGVFRWGIVSTHTHTRTHTHTHTQTRMLLMVSCVCDQQASGVRLHNFRTLETLIESYRRVAAFHDSLPSLTEPLDKTRLQHMSPGQGMTHTHTHTHVCCLTCYDI